MRQIVPLRVLLSLAALLIGLPVWQTAQARPPEGSSGNLIFVDEVARQVRWFHQEKDRAKRRLWLGDLKPTDDSRIAVLIGDAMSDPDVSISCLARVKLQHFFLDWPPSLTVEGGKKEDEKVQAWWRENASRLRRQAKLLPQ